MIGAAFALLAAIAPAAPETAPATPEPPAAAIARPADCPPAKIYPPRYPSDMLRAGKSGIAKVRARIDGCGRVTSVELADSSGHPQLNDAALDAVAGFVLPPDMAARAVDGQVVLPMKFGEVQSIDLQKIDWPKSHRRPHYLADETPIPFATIAEYRDADTLRDGPALKPPYGMVWNPDGSIVMTWMQRDKADESIWWLEYVTQPAPSPVAGVRRGARAAPVAPTTVALVRYRLGERDGEPAVRVAMLCERPADECEKLRAFVMKGLPFAKAR
jgi:TonB family protein